MIYELSHINFIYKLNMNIKADLVAEQVDDKYNCSEIMLKVKSQVIISYL